MGLPTGTDPFRMRRRDRPGQLFEANRDDYRLYEDDGEFVLSVELPGFDPEEITVTWNEGILNVAANHNDRDRGRQRQYHRRFRVPKEVDDDDITASYNNGILEVRLPITTEAVVSGKEIDIQT